jgi:CheY-like chemotaxis protein
MPGIDGLEMTRRIKRDPRNRDMLVVALTALAMQGDEERAIAAGCDGYITKPIDTRALGERVRRYLNEAPEQGAVGDPFASAGIDDLRACFLDESRRQVPLWLEELDGSFDAEQARELAHQWVGSGGLLGFRRISMLSRELETLLRHKPLDVAELRESMESLLEELTEPTLGDEAAPPPPAPVVSAAVRPVVVMVDDDTNILALGRALFHSQAIECRTVSDSRTALAAIREARPHAVVLDVNMRGMSGYEVLAALRAEGSRVKVLLLTADEHPNTMGADDFLVKPFNPLELVVKVKRLL